VVQEATNSSSGTATTVATFANPLTAGNMVVAIVAAQYWAAGTHLISAPSGGGGGTWNLEAAADGLNSRSEAVEVWTSANVAGGATQITANHNAYSGHRIWVLEVSGMPTTGPVADGTPGAAGGRSNTANPGTTTPTSGEDVLLISANTWAATSISTPTSYTAMTGTSIGRCAYRVVTGPSGSYGGSWTGGSTNYEIWNAVVVALQGAGGGGPTFTPRGLWFTR